jgi:hypothetical protein
VVSVMISGKHTSGGGLLGGVLLILAVAGCESRRQPDPQFTSGRTALARGQYQSAIETLDGYLQQHRKSRPGWRVRPDAGRPTARQTKPAGGGS